MKKMKLAVLLVMVFVLALQSVGMMPAAAEDAATAASVNDLTVEYIFNGLGDALNYGIVAEEYKQLNHAETSVYVDKLYKYHPDPFLNTQTTYMYGQAYPLYATVSAPAGETLLDMQFALFTANGDSYTMVEDTLYTVTEDTNVTAVGWKLPEDSPYLYKNLYIRQVEEKADGSYAVIAEGSENSAELEVHYGPSVSSAAPSSSYIGEIVSNQYTNAIVIYNTKEHNPPITFGPGNRLVVWQRDQGPMGGIFGGYWIDVSGTNARANTSDVYLEYENEYGYPMYAKLDGVQYEVKKGQGAFYANVNGEKLYLDISFTKETGKAAALLKQATTFSETIGNMTGGTIIHDESKGSYGSYDPSILGNSTVTGPEDENGNVVSLYNVALGDDWDFDEWDLKESIGQQKLLIAPNEYVVFNIVCPAPTGDVIMHPNAENMYIPAAGKEEQTMWGEEDSGASDRVLFNFIYKAEDGTYKPFEGTVKPSNSHGGTLLVPQGSVENDRNPHNGAMIAKYVENNGKEIHQRTMTSPAQTSWVNMLGDSIVTTGAIKIVKKNGTTGELLGGVEFSIYTDEQCTTLLAQEGIENPVSTDATTGAVLIDGLDPGTYYIQESKPQDGYAANDKVYTVEVKAGVTSLVGTKGYVENFKGRGTLRIVKVEEGNDSVKLQGAVFEIYTCKGESFDANSETLLQTCTTNANGEFEIRLDAGDYWIKEIYTPFGYELDSMPIKVTVVKDEEAQTGTNVVVTNEKVPSGTLSFTKVDADDETKTLQDAEFGIYADAACSELLKTFKTAADGTVNLEVPVGTYYVQEITAPTNYQLDDTVYPILIKEGATTQIGMDGVVANEYGTGKLWLKKIEEAHGRVIPLAGAWFGVYQDDVLITTGVTDDKGYVELEVPINNGQSGYVVKELYAPIGYVNSNFSKGELWITKAGEVKQVEGDYWQGGEFNGAISNDKSRETGKLVLFKNTWDLDPNGLPADGKDNRKNVVAIKGAVFGVYFDEACEMPIDGSPFTTDKDGRISIEGLTPGKYWLKELEAADGYVLNEEKLSVDVTRGPGESRVHWTDSYGNDYRWVYNAVDNAAHATLGLTKTLELVDNSVSMSGEYTFDFTMTLAASSAKTTGYTINDGDESVIFSSAETQSVADAFKVTFNEAGVYTFEVKETEGSSTDYIIYDKTPHTVVYTVTEETDGKLTVSSSVAGGKVSFTNKYNKVNISGFKIWEDGEDDSYRLNIDKDTFSPTYLKLFTLNADNSMTEFTELNINNKDSTKTAKLNVYVEGENGNFSWNYEGLPAFDADGNELKYVVKEMTVNGYQTFYINPSDSYSYRPDDDTALYPRPNVTGFQIHNILSKGELTIEKTVDYEGNAPAQKEFQFSITPAEGLTGYHFVDAQGKELTSPVTLTMDYTVGKTATLPVTILFDTFEDTSKTFTFNVAEVAGNEGGWTYDTAKKTVTYTVTRNQANVVDPTKQAVTVTVDKTSNGKAAFTNKYEKAKEATATLTVKKVLYIEPDLAKSIADQNLTDTFKFTVEPEGNYTGKAVYADGKDIAKSRTISWVFPMNQDEYSQEEVLSLTFKEAGTYSFVVSETPDSYMHGMSYDKNKYRITYTVGTDMTVTVARDKWKNEAWVAQSVSDASNATFYNEYRPDHSFLATKHWVGDTDETRPAKDEVNFTLWWRLANQTPEATWEKYTDEYTVLKKEYKSDSSYWDVSVRNLPLYINNTLVEYAITEDALDGYIVTYPTGKTKAESYDTITNTYNLTSVLVMKAWNHGSQNIAADPDVTDYLQLYRKTAEEEEYTLVTGVTPTRNGSLYTWNGLPKADANGNEYTYIIKEKQYPGYLTQYMEKGRDYANEGEGITNKYFESSIDLMGYKYLDGQHPEREFTFELVDESGEVIATATNVTEANPSSSQEMGGFYFTLKYRGDVLGKTYTYTIREKNEGDTGIDYDETEYQVEVTIDNEGNFTRYLLVDGEYVEYDAFMVVFENTTKTASVAIRKIWYDEDGEVAESQPRIEHLLELYILHKDGSLELVKDADGKALRPTAKLIDATDPACYMYVWEGLTPLTNATDQYAVKENVEELRKQFPGYVANYMSDLPENGEWGNYIYKGYETIEENGSGMVHNQVHADAYEDIAFKYVDGAEATEEHEFTFVLKCTTTGEMQTLKNGTEFRDPMYGELISSPHIIPFRVTFDTDDLPLTGTKSYYYELYEVDPGDGKYIYDDTVYKFCVTLDAMGNRIVTYWDEKTQAYTNAYVEYRFNNKSLTSVSVTKEWVGGKYAGTTEPVTLTLYADGKAQTAKPVQEGNVYTWNELPMYGDDDKLIGYTVQETQVPDGYSVKYTAEVGEDGETTTTVETPGGAVSGGKIVNTYYEAKGSIVLEGTKTLEGRALKDGEFSFELKDAAGKVLQTATNDKDGNIVFKAIEYTEADLSKSPIKYTISEVKGSESGMTYAANVAEVTVTLTDNQDGTITAKADTTKAEIKFVNTYEAEGSVTFKGAKFLLGREFKQGDEFTFELLNEAGTVIDTVTINPESGTKADFAFKTIKYELADAGKTYTYTYRVKEKAGTEDGMTYDDTVHTMTVTVSDAGNGSLKVVASDSATKLNFTNTYLAEGSVLFSGNKTMDGKTLVGKDFTFVLTDADGKEIETVTNDKDGKIVFSAIQYALEDAGKTFTYKVYEVNDKQTAVTYDDTVYTVTVKVEDAGNGHLKVTASDNATKLNFTNSYTAKAVLTMNAYKTVNGYKPTVDQVYDFVLLCDDGTEMMAQNKEEMISFGTLAFDEDDIGKTFIYTVKETTEANELLAVDATIYQVAVTVSDGGDGNLKLETEILKDGKRATGVVFANTATATLAISKTVKGPGPDKAYDLKVTFIGVDGKELEGVYDYDGDVKGTITSGGVIALKDGQSVTIVGLPEGATYTVEENAGPAYTVTVNGTPISKAEGTLVGHGKLEFINTVEVTTFSVTKVWEGVDLGEISLTLYADGKQMTPQPEVTREGDKYTYYNLPKYNEEGEEIVYSAKERGIDGYIRIYNNVEPYQAVTSFVHDGGTIINREVEEEVHELFFKIRKVWTGVEANEEIPAITLTLYCNGEKLDVPTPKPDSEGWYRYYDLPKTVNGKIAVYTVLEESIPGFTVTYKTASGEIVEAGVNGGEITNAKIPQTSDPATLGLWLALMGASAALLAMLQRRRKA